MCLSKHFSGRAVKYMNACILNSEPNPTFDLNFNSKISTGSLQSTPTVTVIIVATIPIAVTVPVTITIPLIITVSATLPLMLSAAVPLQLASFT